MPRNIPAHNRSVRVTDAHWDALVRLAEELGCVTGNGVAEPRPSVGLLLSEIAAGSLKVRRTRPARVTSQAARIRAAITANPEARNRDIAAWLGLEGRAGLVNVATERRRMRLRDEASDPDG